MLFLEAGRWNRKTGDLFQDGGLVLASGARMVANLQSIHLIERLCGSGRMHRLALFGTHLTKGYFLPSGGLSGSLEYDDTP